MPSPRSTSLTVMVDVRGMAVESSDGGFMEARLVAISLGVIVVGMALALFVMRKTPAIVRYINTRADSILVFC